MEAAFKFLASYVALACDLGTVLLLMFAALEAAGGLLLAGRQLADAATKKRIWVKFASWIVLALEFALAADIVRTAITPSWNDLGQLAAIAAIRTGLNWFLERDIEAASRLAPAAAPQPPV